MTTVQQLTGQLLVEAAEKIRRVQDGQFSGVVETVRIVTEVLAREIARQQRRNFLLVGWGRWLTTTGRTLEREVEALVEERARRGLGRTSYSGATPSGMFGIAVADDACARRWQQIQHRLARARLPFRAAYHVVPRRDVERAQEARRLEADVRLYLRPPGDDGDVWDAEVDWWRSPEYCRVEGPVGDDEYVLRGYSSEELRRSSRCQARGHR